MRHALIRLWPGALAMALFTATPALLAEEPIDQRPSDRGAVDTTNPDRGNAQPGQSDKHAAALHDGKIVHASKLIGKKVHDSANKDIATIDDIVVRPDGKIAYVVLRHGSTLGVGGDWYAAPMAALSPGADEGTYKLMISETDLQKSPKLEGESWPTGSDAGWRDRLNRDYRVTPRGDEARPNTNAPGAGVEEPGQRAPHSDLRPAGDGPIVPPVARNDQTGAEARNEAGRTPAANDAANPRDRDAQIDRAQRVDAAQQDRIIRVSKLIGMNLDDSAGEEFGEVYDVLIDKQAERASFVVVSYGGTLGVGESLAVAPFSVLNVKTGERNQITEASLNADAARLKASTMKKDELDQLAQRDRANRIYQSYEQTPYWETFGTERDRQGLDPNRDPNRQDPSDRTQPNDADRTRGAGQGQPTPRPGE